MKYEYDYSEIYEEIMGLEHTFDQVRVVDPLRMKQCMLKPEQQKIVFKDYQCYRLWDKAQRCRDCVSMKALKYKTRYTKFEFIEDEVYYVVAKYIKINGQEYVLEVVTKIDNKIEVRAEGYNEFVERIHGFHQALYYDDLTATYNRRYLKEQLPFMLEQNQYQEEDLGLAVIDIDYLKQVNDTYGHQMGDELIRKVAEVLRKNTRVERCDFITRYGGDEFVFVMNQTTQELFKKQLEQMIEQIREITIGDRKTHRGSISIGAAMASELEILDMDKLIKKADERLYVAKSSGKNQKNFGNELF